MGDSGARVTYEEGRPHLAGPSLGWLGPRGLSSFQKTLAKSARLAADCLRKLTILQRVTGHPPYASEGKPSVGCAHVLVSVLQKSTCTARSRKA